MGDSNHGNTKINNEMLRESQVKSGKLTPADFSGNPRTASVLFSEAFNSTDYSMSVVGCDSRAWAISSITASGFDINSGSSVPLTGDVFWNAIKN